MEQINRQDYEGAEIDLYQCTVLFIKHKITFFVVFLFVLGIGLWHSSFFSEVYRTSVILKSSYSNEALAPRDDFKFAKDLKELIVSNSFNEILKERLGADFKNIRLEFYVVIPDKTDVLLISVDLKDKEKQLGVIILKNLVEIVSEKYLKNAEAERIDIARKINFNKRNILIAEQKNHDLQDQVNEITIRVEELIKMKTLVNTKKWRKLKGRKALSKINIPDEDMPLLLLAIQSKDNSKYLNLLDKQLNKLLLHKADLDLELGKAKSQINILQAEMNSLSNSGNYIPNLRIISQPKLSPTPIKNLKKIKTFNLLLIIGILSGALAVLLRESVANKLKKI